MKILIEINGIHSKGLAFIKSLFFLDKPNLEVVIFTHEGQRNNEINTIRVYIFRVMLRLT